MVAPCMALNGLVHPTATNPGHGLPYSALSALPEEDDRTLTVGLTVALQAKFRDTHPCDLSPARKARGHAPGSPHRNGADAGPWAARSALRPNRSVNSPWPSVPTNSPATVTLPIHGTCAWVTKPLLIRSGTRAPKIVKSSTSKNKPEATSARTCQWIGPIRAASILSPT